MNYYIKRVFFHELGHLVAKTLNNIHFNGSGTSAIKIYPCENKKGEYCGETFPILPEGFNEKEEHKVPKERLGSSLASLIYGCIFQSYWEKKNSINECLETNGCQDICDWRGQQNSYGLIIHEKLNEFIEEHYDILCSHKLLDNLFNIEPKTFLMEEDNDNYTVDIIKLKSTLEPIIHTIEEAYIEFVQKQQNIIDNSEEWKPTKIE